MVRNMTPRKDCAVVLLWYGKPKLAARALSSLAIQKGIDPNSVYCFDNGSQSAHGIEIRAGYPQFNHRSEETNTGFSGGFNKALRWAFEAGYDSALFLTSDTELIGDALDLCIDSAKKHQADLVAPRIHFRRPPHPLDAWGGRFDPHQCRLSHYRETPQPEKLMPPWDYIPGTALWLTSASFHRLNGVNEAYFMYWEDVDFCLRAHKAGLKMARSPAVIHHGGGETCAKKPLYTTFYYLRNRIRFCRLHLEGPERDSARTRLALELETLFEKWRKHGDSLRCEYIVPLQEELALW